MDLKDKLDLIWKYLLLVVIAIGVISFTFGRRHHRCYPACGMKSAYHWFDKDFGKHKMKFDHNDMDIRIEKKIIDGDTTVVVFMDGEEIEVEEIDKENGHVIKTKDGRIIKLEGDKITKHVRIKKKR